jgi:hypothetical protein
VGVEERDHEGLLGGSGSWEEGETLMKGSRLRSCERSLLMLVCCVSRI